jgi:hypothetical protein
LPTSSRGAFGDRATASASPHNSSTPPPTVISGRGATTVRS